MLKLDFVAVGPQRTATSWLDQMLRVHPAVRLPYRVKETMFFDERFEKGMTWFAAHFPPGPSDVVYGEVGPSYFDRPEAVERIKANNPECRIIVTLRDPVARCFSLYRHHLSKGRVEGSLREATDRMPRILESGRYATHLPRWIAAFGLDWVRVFLQEDCERTPERVLAAVFTFLQIEPINLPASIHARVGKGTTPRFRGLARLAAASATWLRSHRQHSLVELGKRMGLRRVYSGGERRSPVLTTQDQAWLRAVFAPDVEYVEQLLERRLPEWR